MNDTSTTINLSENELFSDSDDGDDITLSDWASPLGSYSYSNYPAAAVSTTSGTVGGTLSTTLNNGLLWNNPIYTATASPYTITTGTTTYNNQPQVLKVSGNAEFEGEVTIRGVKLDERLNAIEERLGILRPNNDLEGKWENLKKLGEEYRKLEKEILEGESIWDMLKK